jgi:surfeit locus 1 family protein
MVISARRGRWWILAGAVVGVVITSRLGVWQLDRAAQKQALHAAIAQRATLPPLSAGELARSADAAAEQHHRLVRLRGVWVNDRTVFLDNRQMAGQPGFFVITPLAIDGSAEAVLVQRGWVPRHQQDRTLLPALPAAAGPADVVGRIAPPPARLYEFEPQGGGAIRQNLDIPAFAIESGLRLLPVSVLQQDAGGGAADGLRRQWLEPAAGVHKHYGYAFQWFALAALMAGLYVWFQLVRPRLSARG